MTEIDALLPQLNECLVTDVDARTGVAMDFGRIISELPRAVLRPQSAGDISTVLRYADHHSIPVVARGRGHSGYGQAQVSDGIVVEMDHLAEVHHVGDDHVVVGAGARWLDVLHATLKQHRTPPVLTDYLGVSVGGTLSAGGVGGASHRHGVQTDNVLSLEVVTGDGVVRTCSPTESPDLFHAVLAGLGRCGVITQATLRLAPAPARVRRYKLYYATAAELLSHQRQLLHDGRFDFLQGQVLPVESGWTHMLEVATYYSPPEQPDDQTALHGLGYNSARDQIDDLSYFDFANRLADTATYLEQTGEWHHPHPWPNLFLPDSATDAFLEPTLADLQHADLGASGLLLVYPIFTRPLTTPLFRVPDESVVFLVAGLRFAPPDDPAAPQRLIVANRQWYETALESAGTVYPVGTIPFDEADWRSHYGPTWAGLAAAKQRYDPRNILRPGLVRN
ncbi:FAD-binding protein [Amycolatopsis sp. K13G38]|uniref:FAD-binding protein n=1 Tax=Amycolatopsis acididurans TaxID=2724524 RepID=A0ABX1IWV8_9PSEU|nr:FAD-binding protein [Amycolatopsis acididurans]NKQ51975.1 FAD-binding protein [Amycolatopsis acididurans]